MAKIPRKLKVLNETWDITVVDDLRDERNNTIWGLCSYKAKNIQVDGGLDDDQEKEVALHEVLHAIVHKYRLHPIMGEHEEQIVDNMACGVMTVLKDNPKFKEWLLDC